MPALALGRLFRRYKPWLLSACCLARPPKRSRRRPQHYPQRPLVAIAFGCWPHNKISANLLDVCSIHDLGRFIMMCMLTYCRGLVGVRKGWSSTPEDANQVRRRTVYCGKIATKMLKDSTCAVWSSFGLFEHATRHATLCAELKHQPR